MVAATDEIEPVPPCTEVGDSRYMLYYEEKKVGIANLVLQ